eukprot:6980769-Prymnesium_polylepis.1
MLVLVNVDTRPSQCSDGKVLVEVLDEFEQVLPAAGADRAVPVLNATGRIAVLWKAGPAASPESLLSKSVPIRRAAPMRIRFTMSGAARLYAFKVKGAQAGPL